MFSGFRILKPFGRFLKGRSFRRDVVQSPWFRTDPISIGKNIMDKRAPYTTFCALRLSIEHVLSPLFLTDPTSVLKRKLSFFNFVIAVIGN